MTRPVRALLFLATALLCGVVFGAAAGAHSGIQSYVYVSISDSAVDGRVEFPVGDLAEVLGIDFPDEPDRVEEAAVANADAIRAYAAEHLSISDDEGDWELSFTDDPGYLAAAGGYVLVPFTVERSFDGAPRSFQVDYDGIIHANPERDALFLVENDWGTARFDNEGDHLLGFSVGLTSQAIELEDVGTLESIGAARGLGTDLIRDGVDHLLFVVALLAPVALAPAVDRRSGRAPTALDATRRALTLLAIAIVTSSIVLWVLGLAEIDWSPDLLGTLVAGSLLVMAVYAVWRFTTHERLVVALLAAVQGIGFAQAHSDVRLDRLETPLTLLAFNLGTIVGIVMVAVLVFPLLLLLRRLAAAGTILTGLAGVISLYAVAWLIERVGGVDLPIERIATPLSVWPRNLGLMLLAWALAGALVAWAARRDALRPVEGRAGDPDDEQPKVMS